LSICLVSRGECLPVDTKLAGETNNESEVTLFQFQYRLLRGTQGGVRGLCACFKGLPIGVLVVRVSLCRHKGLLR